MIKQIVIILIGFSIFNLILGTIEINHVWKSNTFICNIKTHSTTDICDKKIGFFFWYLILSTSLLAITIGLISRNIVQAVLMPISTVTLWDVLIDLLSRSISIPILYSWERSSLHYGFFSIFPAWWEFIGLPLLIFLSINIFFGLVSFYIKRLILVIIRRGF